jgi:hypothetical protein
MYLLGVALLSRQNTIFDVVDSRQSFLAPLHTGHSPRLKRENPFMICPPFSALSTKVVEQKI